MQADNINNANVVADLNNATLTLLPRLKEAAKHVGMFPPAQATVRGIFARTAIRSFQRLLFWYTSQIQTFHKLSIEAHETELRMLHELYMALRKLDQLALSHGGAKSAQTDTVTPGASILDQMVTSYPSDQNAVNIFKGEWSSRFPVGCDLDAGPIPLFEDPKVHWAVCEIGGIKGLRILELGPLEGGHTHMLHQRGAGSILSIESNTRAFLKCLIVKNIFQLDKATFRCGDFMAFLRETQERFDFVLAAGVLYHLINPVELLQLLSKITDRVFIWTHYYDEAIISKHAGVAPRMTEMHRATHAGFSHMLHRYEYRDALTIAFTGGTNPYSCWMERDEIIAALQYFGFHDIRVAFEQPDHPNGSCFALLVQR